jgi:hypothetical protein
MKVGRHDCCLVKNITEAPDHHGCIMPDHVELYSDNYATRLALPWFS